MATAEMLHEVKTPKPANILLNSHFLLISRSFISRAKTIPSSQLNMQVATDQSLLHHQKDLFQCSELRAIASLDLACDSYIKSHSLPFPTHKGLYILPLAMFDMMENELSLYVEKRKELVEKFIDVYEERILESKERLKDLFNPADYATKEQARNAFKFSWSYKNFGVAEGLENVNKEVAKRENEKYKTEIENASLAVQQMLRTNLQSLVTHLVDRLTPSSDGKKKVLRSSAVDGLNEFLTTFPALNLAGDAQLASLVSKAKQLTNGVTPEELRTNDALRDNLQTQFATISKQLGELVVDQPSRGISFEG